MIACKRYVVFTLFILSMFILMPGISSAWEEVENVHFEQMEDDVHIYYDLRGDADKYKVTVRGSSDGGRTYTLPMKTVSGDIGKKVHPGSNKKIIWKALKDAGELEGDEFVFEVEAVLPAVQDEAGNLKIIAFDIADKFIDNSKIGKLFIISGKVKNEYSEARSFIRVTGKLYAKGKILSKSATIYCGNVLSDQALSNMDINSINKKLANRLGNNKSNVNVKPGKLLQFMIVFPNIPDNIEEYTVEVVGSSPA